MHVYPNNKQASILIVDDNEIGRKTLRAMLENAGILVCEAKTGLEAVNMVDAEEFDLILMDIQMPVLDGRNAARAIRALDKDYIENLPIIAMTAYTFNEFRSESLASGMNSHVSKPIELEALYSELRRWLPTEKFPLLDLD